MTRRDIYGYLAVLLALVTAAGLVWYLFYAPHYLKIAVTPPDTGLTRFLQAMSATMEKERSSTRLQVIQLATSKDVNAYISSGRSDLAVVRSDTALPPSSLAVASFQNFIALTMVRRGAGIANFADLASKNIAVVEREEENTILLRSILQLHRLPANQVKTVSVRSYREAADLAENNKVDVVFIAEPRGSPMIERAYDAMAEAWESAPLFIAISEFKTMPGINPAFTKSELAAGEVKANPRTPDKTVRTFTFPVLIVARKDERNSAIQEFTRNLFAFRLSLADRYPAATRLAALPTKRDATFPLHPGAAIYFDASEVSFLEKYSDLMWLALFGFSGIASIFVWFWRLAIPKGRILIHAERGELGALIERARDAANSNELDTIERQADKLVISLANQLYDGTLDAEARPPFDLLLGHLTTVIEARRQTLKTG